ncbi:hypothetical protein R3I93_015109 [Phoxinus phoxinus]|uniref:Uncharacterized protein n=1 Tax=Phoxinus phoxinus TaxID=58324 RepID=A0AAN9CKQ3_9TELE
MKLIFGLMLLLKTAACLEFNCSFLQAGPCNAVLGDKLSLQLVDTREYDLMKIQKRIRSKDTDPVCKIKNDRINKDECDLFNNRRDEVSVNNGILIINSVIRADSGNYRLQVDHPDGTITYRDLQVIIEGVDPVVIITVVLGCLAVVLIILVIVAYHFYKKKNRLKPTANVSGNVNEQKKLNRDEEQKKLNRDEEQKKLNRDEEQKKLNRDEEQKKLNRDEEQKKLNRDEEQKRPDVEYATVNSQNQKKKKKKRREEEEVHYGEVTFTSASAQRPPQTREDCVYSEVHTR